MPKVETPHFCRISTVRELPGRTRTSDHPVNSNRPVLPTAAPIAATSSCYISGNPICGVSSLFSSAPEHPVS
jgi:hypothetical protein